MTTNSAARSAAGAARVHRSSAVTAFPHSAAARPSSRRSAYRDPLLAGDGLVVDRLDGADHGSTQKRSWTRFWAAVRACRRTGGRGAGARSPRRAGGVARRDEEAGPAVLDHLRDAADGGGDDRPRQRHRLQDREALRLAVGRQDGDVERGGHGGDVVAAAGERDATIRASSGASDPPAPRAARAASPRRRPAGARSAPRQGRPATPRAASDGPSPARAGRRRRRSGRRRGSRTRRAACGTRLARRSGSRSTPL